MTLLLIDSSRHLETTVITITLLMITPAWTSDASRLATQNSLVYTLDPPSSPNAQPSSATNSSYSPCTASSAYTVIRSHSTISTDHCSIHTTNNTHIKTISTLT